MEWRTGDTWGEQWSRSQGGLTNNHVMVCHSLMGQPPQIPFCEVDNARQGLHRGSTCIKMSVKNNWMTAQQPVVMSVIMTMPDIRCNKHTKEETQSSQTTGGIQKGWNRCNRVIMVTMPTDVNKDKAAIQWQARTSRNRKHKPQRKCFEISDDRTWCHLCIDTVNVSVCNAIWLYSYGSCDSPRAIWWYCLSRHIIE
jgi:hypothetical protein